MTRQPRQISSTGIYHIVFRGMNHCHIFEETEDFEKFLEILANVATDMALDVYAYCLLDNHVHLVVREQETGDIVLAMRRILGPYAFWFNRKYQRSGSLVANRYKSECVEDDEYLLALIRYVHQNPVAAGIESSMDKYRWSSFQEYLKKSSSFINTEFVLKLFRAFSDNPITEFLNFHKQNRAFKSSLSERPKRTQAEVLEQMKSVLGSTQLFEVGSLKREERDALLASLKREGFTVRQIERATGVPRSVVGRA